jgi:hypothetical protein
MIPWGKKRNSILLNFLHKKVFQSVPIKFTVHDHVVHISSLCNKKPCVPMLLYAFLSDLVYSVKNCRWVFGMISIICLSTFTDNRSVHASVWDLRKVSPWAWRVSRWLWCCFLFYSYAIDRILSPYIFHNSVAWIPNNSSPTSRFLFPLLHFQWYLLLGFISLLCLASTNLSCCTSFIPKWFHLHGVFSNTDDW